MVAVAVELDDQPVIWVERVDLEPFPARLELRDREIEGDQERLELVLKDAAARRFLGVVDVGGARTESVQAREFCVGQVPVAARLVDQTDQLGVGQARGDVRGRPRDRRDGDAVAGRDVGLGQGASCGGRGSRVDPKPARELTSGTRGQPRSPYSAAAESWERAVRAPHASTAASARASGVRCTCPTEVHALVDSRSACRPRHRSGSPSARDRRDASCCVSDVAPAASPVGQ